MASCIRFKCVSRIKTLLLLLHRSEFNKKNVLYRLCQEMVLEMSKISLYDMPVLGGFMIEEKRGEKFLLYRIRNFISSLSNF